MVSLFSALLHACHFTRLGRGDNFSDTEGVCMAKASEWEARVASWRVSGKTSAEFCKGHGYSAKSLLWWFESASAQASGEAEGRASAIGARDPCTECAAGRDDGADRVRGCARGRGQRGNRGDVADGVRGIAQEERVGFNWSSQDTVTRESIVGR